MSTIVLNGKIIHKSQNLRGILDHARRTPVVSAFILPKNGGDYFLYVNYYDGSHGISDFADYSVCKQWIKSRRSWGLKLQDEDWGIAKFNA